MILTVLKSTYSLHFAHEVDIVCYKRQIGVLLDGEFILFLSKQYVEDVYGVSTPRATKATCEISNIEIIRLVKQEKRSREKLNRLV